jgi:3-hydroxyisobutyrate dehydrogenase-like beta-hydroxyacid dehydrogenase
MPANAALLCAIIECLVTSSHRTNNRGAGTVEAGFLGVGNMGLPMAGKLLDGGHKLTVYDIRPAALEPLLERQARLASSPKDLANQCEIVFVSLPTLAAFRAVMSGEDA